MLKTPDSVISPDLSSEGQTRLFICRAATGHDYLMSLWLNQYD